MAEDEINEEAVDETVGAEAEDVDADDLDDDDDGAVPADDDDDDVADGDDDAEKDAPKTKRKAAEEDDDDDDELLDDDVEEDLDKILKDRLVAADEEEEADEPEPKGEGDERLQPKQQNEQLCSSCFLLVKSSAPNCPVGDDDCPIFS
jgi:hypothetical protein